MNINDTVTNGFGHWDFAIFNIIVFLFFSLSYFRPKSKIDWRACGGFLAFVIALFTEMYGFPLTVYFLSSWLLNIHPGLNLFAHSTGRLWQVIFNLESPQYFWGFFVVSNLFIWGGIWLLIRSWQVLYTAQRKKKMATTGPYSRMRHPQYLAFALSMIGFLIQWPTIPTLAMFPVLLVTYYFLAKREEQISIQEFGEDYLSYKQIVPPFWPRISSIPLK